jgi:hypothetical protein
MLLCERVRRLADDGQSSAAVLESLMRHLALPVLLSAAMLLAGCTSGDSVEPLPPPAVPMGVFDGLASCQDLPYDIDASSSGTDLVSVDVAGDGADVLEVAFRTRDAVGRVADGERNRQLGFATFDSAGERSATATVWIDADGEATVTSQEIRYRRPVDATVTIDGDTTTLVLTLPGLTDAFTWTSAAVVVDDDGTSVDWCGAQATTQQPFPDAVVDAGT